jgi:hypothetical protein
LPPRFSIEKRTKNINIFSQMILSEVLVRTSLLGPELVGAFGSDGGSTHGRLGLEKRFRALKKFWARKNEHQAEGQPP